MFYVSYTPVSRKVRESISTCTHNRIRVMKSVCRGCVCVIICGIVHKGTPFS